jgi:hypothetical protein
MDKQDLLTLESAVTAIEEAASAVAREVERDRLRETSLARLSTVEAELNRKKLVNTPASQQVAWNRRLVSISAFAWAGPG